MAVAMPRYLDDAQRRRVECLQRSLTAKTDWPTWLLLIGVYSGWITLHLASPYLGLWLTTVLATGGALVLRKVERGQQLQQPLVEAGSADDSYA